MSDNQVEVRVSANTAALNNGMQQAPSIVERAAEAMRGHFARLRESTAEHMGKATEAVQSSTSSMSGMMGGLSGAFGKVNVAFASVAAILAGGAMFASGIKATQQFTGEANKLAKTLAITTTEASALNVALGDIGSDSETFTGAAAMLGRQIKQNEGELLAMGLQTRDASGHLRNMNDLMMDSITVINGYKEGTDRNLAATAMWGRGAAESTSLLRLNSEVVAAAKKKQEELGLVVGQENVDASRRYKAAMNDVGDVMLALKKSVGDAVMPIMTRLGEWFAEIAPPAVFAFKVALDAVATAVHLVIGALRQLWIIIGTIADPIATLGRAIRKLIEGDVRGAQMEMTNIFTNWGNAFATMGERMKADAKQTWTDITALWGKPTPTAAKAGKGKDYTGKPEKEGSDKAEKSQMSVFEAQLEAERVVAAERDALHGMSKQAEQAFWDSILATTTLSEADRVAVGKKSAAARVAVLQHEAREANQIGETNLGAWQQRALAAVDQEAEAARNRVALGQSTQAELLTQEAAFEQRRFEIKLAAMQANAAALDPTKDPVQIAQINAQIEALELQHQQQLSVIRGRSVVEAQSQTMQVAGSLQSGFASVIANIGTSIKSVGGFVKSMGQVVLQTFTQMLAQMAAKWLVNKLLMKAINKATALGDIAAEAGKAGAGGVASMAAAPFPMNLGAPMFGASMSALAMGFMPMASASGGYDIPAGVNPMTQLHEREMVLPAKHADVIRDLADNGGPGQGGGDLNVTVRGASAGDFFMLHKSELVKALKSARRDLNF